MNVPKFNEREKALEDEYIRKREYVAFENPSTTRSSWRSCWRICLGRRSSSRPLLSQGQLLVISSLAQPAKQSAPNSDSTMDVRWYQFKAKGTGQKWSLMDLKTWKPGPYMTQLHDATIDVKEVENNRLSPGSLAIRSIRASVAGPSCTQPQDQITRSDLKLHLLLSKPSPCISRNEFSLLATIRQANFSAYYSQILWFSWRAPAKHALHVVLGCNVPKNRSEEVGLFKIHERLHDVLFHGIHEATVCKNTGTNPIVYIKVHISQSLRWNFSPMLDEDNNRALPIKLDLLQYPKKGCIIVGWESGSLPQT